MLVMTIASAASILMYGLQSISKPVRRENRAVENTMPTLISCSQIDWLCKIAGSRNNDNPNSIFNKIKTAVDNKQFSYKLVISKPSGDVIGDINNPELKFKVKNNEEFTCRIVVYDKDGTKLDCDFLSGVQKCFPKNSSPTPTNAPTPTIGPTTEMQISPLATIIPTATIAPTNTNLNVTEVNLCTRGDFNNDGATNARDFAALLTHIGSSDTTYDLDGDRAATTLDLVKLMNNCFQFR